MAGFIGVHIGAGNHASTSLPDYTKICKEACRQGTKMLAEGRSALDAATEAIALLEDSPFSNAGHGSTLNLKGEVECDASVMEGHTKHWGAVGAVSGVKNPCRLAREICVQQANIDVLGRIPPCLLVGEGARDWANRNNITVVDPASLIHDRAKKKYEIYKSKLVQLERMKSAKCMEQLDTVGAVCIDSFGHTAAVCSSGGIALKESGRVGQAAMFGAGCWAENADISVACCTSGCGEHILRCSLAERLSSAMRQSGPLASHAPYLHQAMNTHFLDSPMLCGIEERLGGALVLVYQDGCGEFMWTHSAPSFVIAHSKVNSTPKSVVSTLPENQTPGKGLVVGGVTFKLDISKET